MPVGEREQLKREAFGLLDKAFAMWPGEVLGSRQDGNGYLNCGESIAWARATGFLGDERLWQQEFLELCKENGLEWIIDPRI